jgi:hypothetical protein
MSSFLSIAILTVSFASFINGDAPCITKLPVFIGCMKQELFPNGNNVDVQTMVNQLQNDLGACFTKNQCTPPVFNQSMDSLFPSSAQNFIDKISAVFKSMSADTKTCLMKETIGKMMGDTCQLDPATQSEITDTQGQPRLGGAFGQLVSYNSDDMEHMRLMMKQVFLAKFNIFRSVRTCQESNPSNGMKALTCLNDYKTQSHQVICPAVKSCAPTTDPCKSKFRDFRTNMCGCHQQCVHDAMAVIDLATNTKSATNVQLVQMIVDGLHFKDLIANAKTCFSTDDPGYKAFSMIESMFNGLDSAQAAVMLQSMDIKGLLGQAKDLLSALNDNEFCQNLCSV